MLFKKYSSFPSDAVIALTTADASITLCNTNSLGSRNSNIRIVSMVEFLKMSYASLNGWIIISMTITESSNTNNELTHSVCETFKVAQRSRNAHAQVNSGFRFDLGPSLNK